MKVTVYNDPGHGWGAVKRQVLIDWGIEKQVSTFSYQRGQTVYLEEDCDLSLLLHTAKQRGITLEFTEKHTNKRSPIRSYDYFRPTI